MILRRACILKNDDQSQRSKRGSRRTDYLLLLLLFGIIVPLGQDPVIAATSRAVVVLRGAALELALHRGDLPEVVQLGGGGALVAGKGGTG